MSTYIQKYRNKKEKLELSKHILHTGGNIFQIFQVDISN